MQPIIVLCCICMFYFTQLPVAQITTSPLKDSLKKNIAGSTSKHRKILSATKPVDVEINGQLNILLDKYTAKQNTAITWAQVKNEAATLLMQYYIAGKLSGATAQQAFYVKMGPATMTANDIAGNKMILICGIAVNKPAEFIVLRIEKNIAQ